ncbi:MAG TPA: septum formation initiator family protein [Candidatus Dormibacteraeota bacterium]|nr:septum formation initiator family protein [Candidatus Dormibacteraeota bacterium]
MNTHANNSPKRKRLEWLVYTLAALILAALLVDGVFGAHGLIATYRLRLQVKQTQQKTNQLNQENQEFTGQVQQLKSDPSAIERVARQKMGLVKPGELVFKLPMKRPANAGATTPSSSAAQTH